MTRNARRILSFILPWLLMTGIWWMLIPCMHHSSVYFIKSFSIFSGCMMAVLYFAGDERAQHQRRAFNITLAVIGFKMLGSAAIFIKYFINNKAEPLFPLLTGAVIYLAYTLLTVGYGYYWAIKK